MKGLRNPKYILIALAMSAIPVLYLVQTVPAQNPPAAAQSTAGMGAHIKTGFVDIQQVIATCEEGKGEGAKFQQWAEEKHAALQNMQKELESLKNQLDLQGAKLNDEARAELQDAVEGKESALQRLQQDSQKEADKREQRLTNAIYKKALPVIEKYAQKQNLDSVHFIDRNRDAYISPPLIITEKIIDEYNIAYPVSKAVQPAKK